MMKYLDKDKVPKCGRYKWLDAYCLSKIGASRDYNNLWGAYRYWVGGKMFALLVDDKDRPWVNLKLQPEDGYLARQAFSDITPGYHMNKTHWNAVNLNGKVPINFLKNMVDKSHGIVLGKLSKKIQETIRKEGNI
jgi:predicted DNA-binding protein (MmcQ/YjbR family)